MQRHLKDGSQLLYRSTFEQSYGDCGLLGHLHGTNMLSQILGASFEAAQKAQT